MLENLPDAVGEALEGVRAGLIQTLFHAVDLRQGMARIQLASLAFADHAPLPEKYTADGPGDSPPLHWSGVPAGAAELVLIVEDADSPTPLPLVHAIVHGLPVEGDGSGALAERALNEPDESDPPDAQTDAQTDAQAPALSLGRNSLLMARWLPPDPPPGHGVHRYVFQLWALEAGDALPETPGREALAQAIAARGLASGCLIGTYERPSTRIPEPLAGAATVAVPTG